MWYIVKHGEKLDTATDPRFDNFGEARDRAEALHASFGSHYHVTKVHTVWTTLTLHEAMSEKQ
jgi:hypothetical protein